MLQEFIMCDLVCKNRSYSLFNNMYLATCNENHECGITLKFVPYTPSIGVSDRLKT